MAASVLPDASARMRSSSSGWRAFFNASASAERGRGAVKILRKAGADKVRLHLSQDGRAQRQDRGLRGDCRRQGHQDAMNFRLLFIQQAHQLIVLLNGLKRLNEDGLPGRR